jgi:5-methylcytosine-specific restriction endonuclease McrA
MKKYKNNRTDAGYEEFRQAVLKRDCNKCRFPGCKKRTRLQVHHILTYSNYAAYRTNPNNGITLCIKHHKEVKGKELIYAALFLSIIQNENN